MNNKLADTLGIPQERRDKIGRLHKKLQYVCSHPNEYAGPVLLVEILENELQLMWGFDRDSTKHTWWNKIDGCTCPVLDNKDLLGTRYRIYSESCKWHGVHNEP